MSEQGGKVEMVAKEELEKLQAELSTLKSKAEKAEKDKDFVLKELDETRLEFLNPDYIAYKEATESGTLSKASKRHIEEETGEDLSNMTPKQLIELISGQVTEELRKEFGPRIDKVSQDQRQLGAYIEYSALQKKYGEEEVEQYKPDMKKIFNADKESKYTFEDAYLLARQRETIQKSREEKEREAKSVREKPGMSGHESTRSFKSPHEASDDAWERAVGKRDTL